MEDRDMKGQDTMGGTEWGYCSDCLDTVYLFTSHCVVVFDRPFVYMGSDGWLT
jgi:hypothetical protein